MNLGSQAAEIAATRIAGTLAGSIVRRGMHKLSAIMPIEVMDVDKVEMDISKQFQGGMAPITVPGTPSPIVKKVVNAGGRMSFSAVEIREKVVIDANDMVSFRKLGTRDTEIDTSATNILLKYAVLLRNRQETRLEWMRAQSLYAGSLSYTHPETSEVFTVSYPHPSYLEFTAGTAWTNPAAKPIDDIATWVKAFDNTAIDPNAPLLCMVSPETVRNIQLTTQVRELWQNAWINRGMQPGYGLGDAAREMNLAMMTVLQSFLGDRFKFETYEAESINYANLLTAVNTVATNLVLDNVENMAVGDILILQDRATGVRIERALTGVTVATKTVAIAAATGVAFPAGSIASVKKRFADKTKMLILAVPDLEMSNLSDQIIQGVLESENPILPTPTIGKMVATRNRYKLDDTTPGFFSKVTFNTDDQEYAQTIAGITALPMVAYPEYFLRISNV